MEFGRTTPLLSLPLLPLTLSFLSPWDEQSQQGLAQLMLSETESWDLLGPKKLISLHYNFPLECGTQPPEYW